jgi:hypothetical protein
VILESQLRNDDQLDFRQFPMWSVDETIIEPQVKTLLVDMGYGYGGLQYKEWPDLGYVGPKYLQLGYNRYDMTHRTPF